MSNQILNAVKAPNKFNSPDAYDKYIANYNYLINDKTISDRNTSKLNDVNTKLEDLLGGADVKFFDKYLSTDAYDNITSDINTAPYNELLRSNIMSDIQLKKIANLNSQINALPTQKTDNNTDIKALKNYSNSRILNVEQRKYYNDGEPETPGKFIVYGNGGCLSYDPSKYTTPVTINGKKVDETYKQVSFKSCDAKDETQLFEMNKISTIGDYNRYADMSKSSMQSIPSLPTNSPDIFTNLNYYLVNPTSSPNMCLNFNDSGLSVQPCNMSMNQKYSSINHHVF